ncbi:hypothetical protein [Pseudobacteriovorax antillogorgiicola]|uniref:Uncharacterized protein n=1 Tax=Pseudobacteriovorax antillogorgiicola TaxID=1513793 RepID=A0A1Y6BQB9_9BACT|nr:hypothetical protein [Pseudobacteriovorax antillogorgiicola]TCS55323.1 hypothetical protein EDD56_10544 [Pseudobacteriovorax antillogorgiicola]SMF14165.1 hypothetical protein SAMN06296036_105280 [Pseudobacteriovorax antillogorgiicola]
MPQVDKDSFKTALIELGHNPADYSGKKLSIDGMAALYELDSEIILDAIDQKSIAAHYDYANDTIWVDALDAAHFYYCIRSEANLYAP